MMNLVQRGILDLSFHLLEETHAVSRLLKKHQDVPISFADACLVRMAERYTEGVIFTLDNDFSIYRKNGRQMIPTLTPAIGRS